MQSGCVKRNRGIFQGDSLSPLHFCVLLITLTCGLNRPKCGYKLYGTERKIIHFLYMEPLKPIGRSDEELRNEIGIVETTSNDIKMEVRLKKYVRVSLKSGNVHRKQHVRNRMENELKELVSMKACMCFVVEENHYI
jgi:hypothetical protein